MKDLTLSEHYKKLISEAKPRYTYVSGEDIVDFQTKGKAELAKLLGIDKIPCKCSTPEIKIEFDKYASDLDCREIRFVFESENEVFVPCHLFIPNNTSNAPLVVALHGHSTGMHVLARRKKYDIDEKTINEQECDFVRQALERGYSALSLEHRGFGERGGNDKGANCAELTFRSMLIGRTLVGDRVFDAKMAISAVIANFSHLVDTKNIICIGYSGGGTVGIYLSALDERIKTSVITSAICTYADSIGAMQHCACNYVPAMAESFDMGNICQLIAPRELVINSGDEDCIFPINGAKISAETARIAYSAYNAQDKITHIISNGPHKFYPKEVWETLPNRK